ncbi:SNC2 [Symbiodinium natans]|uniref:SNC2 protein n=1 Tax=Symbiodinium natans TaxID=878477 RepID=A0A812S7V4_9DINO|nr:SNC2 [Symbiodinium natans]
MAGHPPNGDPQAIGKLRNDLDGAIGVMRDNMRTMAERDAQLHDLEGKSNTLNVASGTFSAHASRLRREQEWQRCKTRLAIVGVFGLIIWLLILWFAAGHRMTFLGISLGIAVIAAPLAWVCVRRWRRLEEQEGFRDVDSI